MKSSQSKVSHKLFQDIAEKYFLRNVKVRITAVFVRSRHVETGPGSALLSVAQIEDKL